MELLAPAGNLEKLRAAYRYGADAAYIGLHGFSLRAQADNFSIDDAEAVRAAKGDRKLYGAFNLACSNADIRRLEAQADAIRAFPFDGFIISDIGLVPVFQKRFPGTELHLSTQANCLNTEAARIYRSLGFSRVIPGREMSLADMAELKQAVPELEIEAFVHGAMCLAYSGRCFLSAWMTGRSANRGACAHSCRWNYQLVFDRRETEAVGNLVASGALALREAERPEETFPIFEGDGFTGMLSSRDLCLIDHLEEFKAAGIDSLKIEGRMKSAYYVAIVTRAYRRELDRMASAGSISAEATRPYIDELYHASHRPYTTGFFFGDPSVQEPADRSYEASHLFTASLAGELAPDPAWLELHAMMPSGTSWHRYELDVKNPIDARQPLEYVSPNTAAGVLDTFIFVDLGGQDSPRALPGRYNELYLPKALEDGTMFRKTIAAGVSTA